MAGVWVAAAVGFAGLLAALASSNIRIVLAWTREKDDDRALADVRALYGIIRYRCDIPLFDFAGLDKGVLIRTRRTHPNAPQPAAEDKLRLNWEKILGMAHRARLVAENTEGFGRWLRALLSRIRCTSFRWKTEIGLGDAAETATAAGIIWGVKSLLAGFLLNRLLLRARPELEVLPRFARSHFSTKLHCILELRLGYAIIAGLLLLVRILKVKGGMKTWQNILFKA